MYAAAAPALMPNDQPRVRVDLYREYEVAEHPSTAKAALERQAQGEFVSASTDERPRVSISTLETTGTQWTLGVTVTLIFVSPEDVTRWLTQSGAVEDERGLVVHEFRVKKIVETV